VVYSSAPEDPRVRADTVSLVVFRIFFLTLFPFFVEIAVLLSTTERKIPLSSDFELCRYPRSFPLLFHRLTVPPPPHRTSLLYLYFSPPGTFLQVLEIEKNPTFFFSYILILDLDFLHTLFHYLPDFRNLALSFGGDVFLSGNEFFCFSSNHFFLFRSSSGVTIPPRGFHRPLIRLSCILPR